MPYSFVWLYLMKCVFTCSIFVDSSTKRFLSVLGVFGKYFVLKIWKFQKSFLPCFGDSVAGKSSHRPQSRVRGSFLATFSRVKGPVARVTQRFSGSVCDSLAGRPSSREKHLEHFSKFCHWVFWRLNLASCWWLIWVAKIACSAKCAHFQHFSKKWVLICLSCTLCLFIF